ncbi:NADPH:quinone reductase-like Zn-dependent oxidoreductase [Inhella inkyongensis]|uniref:NADPH:quinone reductase-like Zn-dependent oxidoreductase n=1 Tax=Inhella inkyongensis TaxID=392593 RepID=A0A840SDF6_9BURK|nr:NAD(P)-dependent alcohol dehydrogenase [Inhella inkyongensis]MBB5206329.1 NADPH:quinone reductase-like Zn-dependent oxidoreductase [Inhella inkyongensis]
MHSQSQVWRSTPGGPARLVPQTQALPTLAPKEVLLRIRAASLNYRDLLLAADPRDGLVPLSDASAEIAALGSDVRDWQVGDRVSPNFFPAWRNGRFSPAALSQPLGGNERDGVLREHLVIEASALVAVPEHLSHAEAATLPCAALTAWHALFERGQLQAGDTVLVQGTGGVALFGLQLAVAAGARVIVTSSSDEKLERARALGAWGLINYRRTPDWAAEALRLTEGLGVDHILELGGPSTYEQSVQAIGFGGRIAQIGVLSGFEAQPNLRPLQFNNASVNGICVGSVAQFQRMNAFISQHQIRPVIDQSFAFEDAAQAFEALRAAQHVGKLVITL